MTHPSLADATVCRQGWGSKMIDTQVFPAKTEPESFLQAAQSALQAIQGDSGGKVIKGQ